MPEDKQKEFYQALRNARDKFIEEVFQIGRAFGTDIIPLPELEVKEFWKKKIDKIIDKDFRHKIERKIKELRKDLHPFYRFFRRIGDKWF